MGKKIDPEAVGDSIAEILARERPSYNQEAVQRHKDMLVEASKEAGLSEQDTQAAVDALQKGYQKRTS